MFHHQWRQHHQCSWYDFGRMQLVAPLCAWNTLLITRSHLNSSEIDWVKYTRIDSQSQSLDHPQIWSTKAEALIVITSFFSPACNRRMINLEAVLGMRLFKFCAWQETHPHKPPYTHIHPLTYACSMRFNMPVRGCSYSLGLFTDWLVLSHCFVSNIFRYHWSLLAFDIAGERFPFVFLWSKQLVRLAGFCMNRLRPDTTQSHVSSQKWPPLLSDHH